MTIYRKVHVILGKSSTERAKVFADIVDMYYQQIPKRRPVSRPFLVTAAPPQPEPSSYIPRCS